MHTDRFSRLVGGTSGTCAVAGLRGGSFKVLASMDIAGEFGRQDIPSVGSVGDLRRKAGLDGEDTKPVRGDLSGLW